MKKSRTHLSLILIILGIFFANNTTYAQKQKLKIRPNADQKLYSFGFTLGIHAQDLILSHTGVAQPNGEVWFSEIPSYSPGFSVGIIADRYISEHFNLRTIPSLYFGEKGFVFKEQASGEEFKTTVKSNYLSIPIVMKYSAKRVNNFRPYMLAGVYGSFEIGSKKEQIIKLKKTDFGLEFGFGCNFYMPLFKLCPEIKFQLGLVDLIEKNRDDLLDKDLLKYTEALSSGKSRMITLTFNFE